MEKKTVTNTTAEAKRNIEEGSMRALVDVMPGMIEHSERRGQRELVESTLLPTDFSYSNKARDRAILESWGFKLGDVVEGDPMFMHVELPDGWTREGTDHAMHSSILDEKGRKRIAIFYKAASYDRSASASLCGRYTIDFEKVSEDVTMKDDVCKQTVIDSQTGEVLKVFTGAFGESRDAADAFLSKKIGDASNASLWDD